jgi:uncharacterized SAM-binding protein YcdF (DUF218 family)
LQRPRANWRKRAFAALVFAGAVAVWAAVAPLLADALIAERPIEKADAIVILSGAADHKQRARGGAIAFRQGIARKVILTNDDQRGAWDDVEKGNPYFIERAAAELQNLGVPAEAIEKLPGKVHGTSEEADLIMRVAIERGYRSLLIVTSDFHSRRALWTFEQAAKRDGTGITIGLMRSPASANYPGSRTWWLSPRGWRSVGAEYVKFAYYWLFY